MSERDEQASGPESADRDEQFARDLLRPAPSPPGHLVSRVGQRVRAFLLGRELLGLATAGFASTLAAWLRRGVARGASQPSDDRDSGSADPG